MSSQSLLLQGGITTGANAALKSGDICYLFDTITEHGINMQSNITDNYLENNCPVQDHIALPPITVSLRGLAGEVVFRGKYISVDILRDNADNLLNNLKISLEGNEYYNVTSDISAQKLGALAQLYPPVDNLTQRAKNLAATVENSAKRYANIAEHFITGSEERVTKLVYIYEEFKKLREAKAIVEVATPYAYLKNMALASVVLRQGNENYITDIDLSLKQVSFTETETTGADKTVLAQYNEALRAKEENQGQATGVSRDISVLKYITSAGIL